MSDSGRVCARLYSPAMEWGDAPAWVAIAASGIAIWVSIKARSDGKRSADAAVQAAATAAESLELQKEAARPKVALRIRRAGEVIWHLVNEGEAGAEGLQLIEDDLSLVTMDPLPEVFASGARHALYLASPAWPPPYLRFIWEGQEEPVEVTPS